MTGRSHRHGGYGAERRPDGALRYDVQVAKVTRPLCSVARVAGHGLNILFSRDHDIIIDARSGRDATRQPRSGVT